MEEPYMADVGIILGSDTDLPKVKDCFHVLKEFDVAFDLIISSAHRSPNATAEWASTARERGIKVIIAVAGGAAHLPGVVAAHTTLPVIGVPIETNISGGLDSILSIIQMPSGIPVGAMPSGKAGGTNAALYALRILSLFKNDTAEKLDRYRKDMAAKISEKNVALQHGSLEAYIKKLEGDA